MTQIYRKFPEGLPADDRSQQGAARRRDALDRLTDLVVGRRGAGRHADRKRPPRQPRLATLLDLRPHGPEADGPGRGIDAARVLDVEGGDFLLADSGQMRGVARVVAADHHHQVERAPDELEHRVLALLSGRADRVEVTEVLGEGGLAVALRHAAAQLGGDRERLAGQHSGLIGDAHAHEIVLRVEPWRHLVAEAPEERVPRPPSLDVLADLPRLCHVPDHQVLPARILGHLARGRLGLLVVGLAVDHVREAVPRVGIDALPHAQHRAANGVDHAAVVVRGERALDRALQPEAFAEVGLLHGPQSNGVVPPARTASITRWILQPSSNVAGGTVGAAPATTRTRSRTSRTKERAHIVLGVSRSHRSSGALTSSSGPSGFIISSFDSPVSTKVPSLPVTWAKCPRPQWATVVRRIVATAPPVIRIVKLANSSAVAGCVMPRSSRRSLTKVAAAPATCDGSLPVQ